MKGLKDTLANLSRLRGRFERLLSSAVKRGGGQPSVPGRLQEVVGFGTNPGTLRMLEYERSGGAASAGRGLAWVYANRCCL
jgi:hypothetical protein